MIYLITSSLIAFSLILSRANFSMAMVWGVFFIILMGLNYDNPDYTNYLFSYAANAVNPNSIQFLWAGSEFLFAALGLSYQDYLVAFSICFFSVFFYAILRLTRILAFSVPIFCVLYFVYPGMIDVVQIRNFAAMACLTLAVVYLYEGKPGSMKKAAISLFIGFGFHTIMLFYFPLLLLPRVGKAFKAKKILIAVAVCMVTFSFTPSLFSSSMENVITAMGINDQRIYFLSGMNANYGQFVAWGIQCFNVLFAFLFARKCGFNIKQAFDADDSLARFLGFVFWVNVFGFIFWDLYLYNLDFIRLIRNFIPLNLIAFLAMCRYKGGRSIGLLAVAYLLFMLVSAAWYLYIPLYEDVVIPVMENNLLLSS